MKTLSLLFSGLLAAVQLPNLTVVVERDTLRIGEQGYLVGPPLHVAGPAEFQTMWARSGRFLAALSTAVSLTDRKKVAMGVQVPFNQALHVFDATTARTATLELAPRTRFDICGWLGTTTSLLVVGHETLPSGPNRNEPQDEQTLYMWKPGETKLMPIMRVASDSLVPQVSSSKPYAIAFNNTEEGSLVLIDAHGKTRNLTVTGYPQEDSEGYFTVSRRNGRDANSRPILSWARVLLDGSIQELSGPPDRRQVPGEFSIVEGRAVQVPVDDPNGIQINMTRTEPAHGTVKTKVTSAWLWAADKGQIRATLLAAEATSMSMSPKKEAVAFVSRENLMVRLIEPVSAKDLDEMLAAAEQREIMNRAKQVGIAMMIYATDCDDQLPPSANWQEVLYPYMRSKSLSEGFIYLMNGDNLSKLEDPTKAKVGYIEGRYGRAIVFGDSHVIWEPRKKP